MHFESTACHATCNGQMVHPILLRPQVTWVTCLFNLPLLSVSVPNFNPMKDTVWVSIRDMQTDKWTLCFSYYVRSNLGLRSPTPWNTDQSGWPNTSYLLVHTNVYREKSMYNKNVYFYGTTMYFLKSMVRNKQLSYWLNYFCFFF